MNINTLSFSGQIYNRAGAQNTKKSSDLKDESFFNSVLDVSIASNDIPDMTSKSSYRWTDVGLYTFDSTPRGYSVNEDALLKVKEQLKSESIDADKRTPTHEITDEQMEWLKSKYDLNYLSRCSISEPEFGNFMLDLAYLNVFSFDEVENMYAGVIPPVSDKPQLVSVYYYGDPETGDGAGYVDFKAEGTVVLENMTTVHITLKFLKAEHPGLTDEEYHEMIAEHISQFQKRLKIFEQIFGFFAERLENTTDNMFLKINDASDKLKEDFGSRM